MTRRSLLLISVAVSILIGMISDLGWRSYTRPRFVVTADGTFMGTLRRTEVARSGSSSVTSVGTPDKSGTGKFIEKIAVRPVETRPAVASGAAQKVQTAQVQAMTDAVTITVNGQDIVAVINESSARAVRDRIIEEYKATILRDAAAIEQVRFNETINWYTKYVTSDSVRTVDEAINILKLGTDKLATYVVKSGDTGWDIARSYDVSTDQLAKANPSTNLDRLKIGEELVVTFKEPYVHTLSVSKKVAKEGIPFIEQTVKDANLWPWQYEVVTAGTHGSRELTIREYREDGRVVKSEVVENRVLSDPKPQIAKQGTKQIPSLGTGTLVYPVVGELTSPFGPRWGTFHVGIDIAAPTGTPILAADAGMVVFRGWSGNYGYLIQLDHGGGKLETWYGHLSRFNVNLGDTVTKGQVIGYVGNTGFSTGPHLHYEVHADGKAVDPLRYYR